MGAAIRIQSVHRMAAVRSRFRRVMWQLHTVRLWPLPARDATGVDALLRRVSGLFLGTALRRGRARRPPRRSPPPFRFLIANYLTSYIVISLCF